MSNNQQQFALAEQRLMQGDFSQALEILQPLEVSNRQNFHYYKAIATCYFGIKEYQLAVNAFEKGYQLVPNDANLLSGYGTALYQNRQIQEAVNKLCAAINLQPSSLEIRIKLIALLKECDHIPQAMEVLREGLKHTPNDPTLSQLQVELSGVVSQQDQPQNQTILSSNKELEALWQNRQFDKLLDVTIAQINKDITLESADELITYLDKVSELQPFWWQICFAKAMCLHKTNRVRESLAYYRQALCIDNNQYDLLLNSAVAFNSQFEFTAGQYCLERINYLGFESSAKALSSLGFSLLETGKYQQAISVYQRSLQNTQGDEAAAFSIGLINLTQGNFKLGWEAYRLRLKNISQYNRALKHQIPVWQGESLTGKTLTIVYEQGHGDTIQFIRFLPQLCRQAKKVIFQVNPLISSLINHFSRNIPNLEIITTPVRTGDYLLSLMELGHILALDEAKILKSCSTYLDAPSIKIEKWQTTFNQTKQLKVGIAWSGNPDNKRDLIRSISFENLAPLLSLSGIQFYSLQIDNNIPEPFKAFIIDLSNDIDDFTDTAAIIHHLDLVISVDTGVAHLAAAMGKPVWLMISHVPDWRWLLNRDDSIWYPSVKLYRQSQNNNWQSTIETLQADLIEAFNLNTTTEKHISLLLTQQKNQYALERIARHENSQAELTTEMYYQKVQALVGTDQYKEALTLATQLTQATIPKASNVYYQGLVASQARCFKQSFDWLAQAFSLMPTNIDWLISLTKCATKLGQTGFALELLGIAERSIGYNKQLVMQKAYTYLYRHDLKSAEIELKQGLINEPHYQEYRFALSQLHLLQQNFTTAWRLYEYRPKNQLIHHFAQNSVLPEWLGNTVQTDQHKKCLLAYGEQGLGDQIMCLRYLPVLLNYFDKINLSINKSLHVLLTNSLNEHQLSRINFINQDVIPADSDFRVALYSLPHKLQHAWRYKNFGQTYLTCKPSLSFNMETWLAQNNAKLKIGLAWQGNKNHVRDDERSIALELLAPLFKLEQYAFCSLQINNDDVESINVSGHIACFNNDLNDMNDTASLASQLDLVISIDTALVHLAGSLGLPCWLLASYLPDPRWLIKGESTYWYDSVKLFRQPQIGDWSSVIKQVVDQLDTGELGMTLENETATVL